MLYQIGPLTLDTRPFNADSVNRRAGADFAKKNVINSLAPREFMGEGDERIAITGQLLPFKIGGLSQLETTHSLCRSGTSLPVLRGDGRSLGWYVIESVSQAHSELMRDGIGFVVKYTINMTKVKPAGAGVIGTILSLFSL